MFNEEIASGQIVDVSEEESSHRVLRRANDRFLVHVETGVDEDRNIGQRLVVFEDRIKARIGNFADQLRSCGSVDVHSGRTMLFHEFGAIVRNSHEFRCL